VATRNVIINVTTRGGQQSERTIRRVGLAASATQKAVNGFRSALVALAAVSAAKGLTEFLDVATRAENRLQLLTGSQKLTDQLFNQLASTATRTRSSLESTVDLYSRLQRSTAELGLSQQQLIDLTAGINQAFQIYGATAAEASAATVQFSQGLASGALRGDELRSVLEQAPRLAQALAEGLTEIEAFGPGVRTTIGDLRALGAEGVLTADLVTKALGTQTQVLEDEFGSTLPTLVQAFQELQNQFLIAFRELGNNTGLVQDLTGAIFDLAANVGNLVRFVAGAVSILIEFGTTINNVVSTFVGPAIAEFTNWTLAIGGTGIALTLLFGPIGALATAAFVAAGAIQQLRDSKTELTGSAETLIQSIDIERESTLQLTKQLDENRVVSIQTARLKLAEAEARIENIGRLEEERKARREALREELQGILLRAAALEENKNNVPLIGAIFNLDENIALIQLEGQAKNALAAFQELNRQGEEYNDTVIKNQDNIRRLNEELASGKLVDASVNRAQLAKDSKKLQTELEKAEEATRRFNLELARIPTGAGTGADALQETERLEKRLIDLQDRKLINERDAASASATLATATAAARMQAVDDIIASIQEENKALALSEERQETIAQLNKANLAIDKVSPEQLAQLDAANKAQLDLNAGTKAQEEAIKRLSSVLDEANGGRGELIQTQTDLVALFQAGALSAQEFTRAINDNQIALAELNLAAGEGTFSDAFIVGLNELRGEFTNVISGLTSEFTGFFSTITQGFGDSIAGAIVDGDDLNESLKAVAREGLSQLISGLIQLGVQYVANAILSQTLGAAALATNAAQAGALASLYAPAAALASLASFGANAAPASAGLVATTTLASVLAKVPGFADGGLFEGNGGPREDANFARISDGEFIVNAAATAQNRALLEAINSGRGSSSSVDNSQRQVNINLPGVTDADSFQRSERQLNRRLERSMR
jgi:tape measure domain-containing protein